ncbi:nuclear inhibitor of protein phosphatase 1, partial [Sarcoptes scabiei]
MNNIEQNHHQQHQQSSSKTSSIDETKRMRYGVKNNLSRSSSSSITSSSIKLSPLSLTATATTVSPSYPKPPLQFQQPDQSSFVFAASKNRSHRLQTFHSFDETNHWLPARSDNIFPLENRTNFVPIDRNNSVRCFDLEQATLAQNKNDDLFDDIVDGRQHHSLIESNSNKRFDSKSKRSKLDRLKSKKNCYQINPINLTARIENNLVETVLEHCDDCVDGEEDREHRHRHQIVSNDLIQNSSAFLPREPSTSSSLSTTSSESASFELDNRNCFESNVPIEPPELFNNNNNNNNNNRTDNTENGSSVSNDQLNQVNNHHHFDRSDETFESKQFLKRFVTKTSDPSTSSTAVASTNPVSFLIHQRRTNRNSATFWDLITDVAKDLDLELQDISPDGEFVLDHRQHQQSTTTTTATKTSKSVTKSSGSKVKTKVVVNDLNSNNYNSNTDKNTQQQQQQQQQQQKQTRKQIVLPTIKAT